RCVQSKVETPDCSQGRCTATENSRSELAGLAKASRLQKAATKSVDPGKIGGRVAIRNTGGRVIARQTRCGHVYWTRGMDTNAVHRSAVIQARVENPDRATRIGSLYAPAQARGRIRRCFQTCQHKGRRR